MTRIWFEMDFFTHIRNLHINVYSLNILKVLSHVLWGSDRLCLTRICLAVVLSRLYYGSVVYSSSWASVLKMLDRTHYKRLRWATGEIRTSPVSNLYEGANEPYLETRRCFLGFIYTIRVCSDPQHPTRNNLESTRFQTTFEYKPAVVSSFAICNVTYAGL